MQRFKLNDKDYFVEVKNKDCIITEFGNKEVELVFSKDELEDLEIKTSPLNAFAANGIIKDVIKEISFSDLTQASDLTQESVIFKMALKNKARNEYMYIPLGDFCKDLLVVCATQDKIIGDNMPCFNKSLKKWQDNSDTLFLDGKVLLLDINDKIVGAGYFKRDSNYAKGHLHVINKCNLALYEELNLCYPDGRFLTVKLVLKKAKSDLLSVYGIKVIELSKNKKWIAESKANILYDIDFDNVEEHSIACNTLEIDAFGKTESVLDSFLDF